MYFKKYLRCQTGFHILIVIASLTKSVDSNNTNNTAVCKTPGCKAAAHIIKRTIDATQDPCNNFYNFACGTFISNQKLKNRKEIGRISLLTKKVLGNLKQALSEKIDPKEPRIFKLVKNYYNACMDLKTINNMGLQPLINVINDLGGWPMVVGNTWNENNFDWIKTLHKLRQYGYLDYILSISVGVNENNNSKPIIEISDGTTVLESEILKKGWDHRRVKDYHKYIVDVAKLLGADYYSIAGWDAYDMINFEAMLAEYADESLEDAFVGSIADMGFNVSEIPWLDLINNMTSPVTNFTITDEMRVPKLVYLKNLPHILQNVSKRTVANYLIWRAIDDSAPYLSNNISQLRDSFNEINEPPPRHEHCISLLKDDEVGIPVGLDAIYIRKFFNNDARDDVKSMIKYISGQMDFYINQLTWLDNQTRNGALEKLRLMEHIVAYPDDFYIYTKLDSFSSDLHIDPKQNFQNFLNIMLFNFEKKISTLDESTDNLSFDTETAYIDVNAFYQHEHNRLKINAAYLQPPLYRIDWPNYMKYGSIGQTIGHEIMHAFDNTSIHFNETGKLTQWYTDQSESEYEKKMQCFVQHYERYYNKELNLRINGTRTLNENLADYGGAVVGYTGYKKWVEKNGKELPLPGLDYTPEQIFWIMAASPECSKSNKLHKKHILLKDEHTLDKFRVFGMVSNSADFAKDFNCPAGSKMNPKKKCSLA